MAAGGGISRFRGKKQPASQQPSDTTPPTADDAGNSLPDGRSSNNVAAPGGAVGDEQPANPTSDGAGEPTIDAMEDDRPSTAFNAFGFDGGDEGRPATSGSHGFFGGLNDMLDNTNDDDEVMVGDCGGDYGGEYQQEYEDFVPQQDDTMGEDQVGSPAKENDYVIGEIGVDINQPGALQMLATTATLSQETATAKGSDAGGGGALEGGGIGKFSKRRTNAPPTKTNATAPPPDTMAEDGAGTKSDVISRGFDVDLMSKNAEDDTGNGSGGKDDEVPLTIRTSDDDVDDIVDDLTEATANFGVGGGEGLRSDNGGSNQESAPTIITTKKTSAYFNNQVVVNENDWAQQGLPHVTVHQIAVPEGPPPRFDTNVTAVQQPLSKVSTVNALGIKEPPTMTHGVTGVTKPTKKRASGGLPLNPSHHGPTARVSLSPIPGDTNNDNRAKSRPIIDKNANNQAGLYSPINPVNEDEDDDTSIVIPFPAAALANENVNVVTMHQKVGAGPAVNPPSHKSLAPMKEKLSSNSTHRSRSVLNQNTNGIGKLRRVEGNKHTASSTSRSNATSASLAKSGALTSTTITAGHRLNAPNAPKDKLPAESEAMETEPQVDETNVGIIRRSRSNSMYTPPPSTKDTESTTPKASNVVNPPTIPAINTNSNTNNGPGVLLRKATNDPTFHTDESFDELLSQFVTDIQEGTDIFERGQSDFLDIEVELSHAFAGVLRYKDEYATFLSEIEGVLAMASMMEVEK